MNSLFYQLITLILIILLNSCTEGSNIKNSPGQPGIIDTLKKREYLKVYNLECIEIEQLNNCYEISDNNKNYALIKNSLLSERCREKEDLTKFGTVLMDHLLKFHLGTDASFIAFEPNNYYVNNTKAYNFLDKLSRKIDEKGNRIHFFSGKYGCIPNFFSYKVIGEPNKYNPLSFKMNKNFIVPVPFVDNNKNIEKEASLKYLEFSETDYKKFIERFEIYNRRVKLDSFNFVPVAIDILFDGLFIKNFTVLSNKNLKDDKTKCYQFPGAKQINCNEVGK